MEADTYHTLAMRTGIDDPSRPVRSPETRLDNAALGLAGESGEFNDHIKKWLYHGHPLDKEKLRKELGDILWYVTLGADALGNTLSEIMQMNLDKLQVRYPNGFSTDASLNRTA